MIPGSATNLLGLPFGWGAIFALMGTVATTLLGGGVLGVWIKTRAEMKAAETARAKVDIDGDAQLRREMWEDIAKLKLSNKDVARRLADAEQRLVGQSVELGQHRFLLKLVTDELDRVSPGNPVAKQAREMLMDLQRQAMPMSEEMAEISEMVAKLCRTDGNEEG